MSRRKSLIPEERSTQHLFDYGGEPSEIGYPEEENRLKWNIPRKRNIRKGLPPRKQTKLCYPMKGNRPRYVIPWRPTSEIGYPTKVNRWKWVIPEKPIDRNRLSWGSQPGDMGYPEEANRPTWVILGKPSVRNKLNRASQPSETGYPKEINLSSSTIVTAKRQTHITSWKPTIQYNKPRRIQTSDTSNSLETNHPALAIPQKPAARH